MEMIFEFYTYLVYLYKIFISLIESLTLFNANALQLDFLDYDKSHSQWIYHLITMSLLVLDCEGVGLQELHPLDVSQTGFLLSVNEIKGLVVSEYHKIFSQQVVSPISKGLQ